VGLHQVIATQAAAVLVLIGMVLGGPARFAAVAGAAVLLALTWARARGRWVFEWIAAGLRFRARRRPGAGIFELAVPGIEVTSTDLPGGPAAVLADASGLTMLLELGDPAGLLAEARPALPAPWELLPAGPGHPPARIQLLLTGAPAPIAAAGSGPVAGSYRMLTQGRVLGHARAVLAVRVARAEGWSDGELRQALTGQVRKLAKRLTAQPLDRPTAVRLLFDLAYADPAAEIHEEWTALRTGGQSQVTFHGHSRHGTGPSAELLGRLLQLPVTATTVTLTADLPDPDFAGQPAASLAVRLTDPEPATVEAAITVLRRLTAREGIELHRRDGDHLPGLTATLPLAVAEPAAPTDRAPQTGPQPADGTPGRPKLPMGWGGLALPTSWAGLAVGRNRQGQPVVVRLFRPEHTGIVLVGGIRCAQLLAFRAIAIGARVLVRTNRPRDWATFAHGAAAPSGTIGIAPPGHPVEPPPSSPLHPLLTILDLGPSPRPPRRPTRRSRTAPTIWAGPPGVTRVGSTRADPPHELDAWPTDDSAPDEAGPPAYGPDWVSDRTDWPSPGSTPAGTGADGPSDPAKRADGGPWEATLTVRDEIGPGDAGALLAADLLLAQPLSEPEAELVGGALSLGDTTRLLGRMRPGMVGVLGRQAVRWAMLAPTPVEKVLIGDVDRPSEPATN
jgi:type VII secretion protein EccE